MKKPALFATAAILIAAAGFAIGRFTAPVDIIVEEEIDVVSGGAVIDVDKESQIRSLKDQIAALRQREAELQSKIVAQDQPPLAEQPAEVEPEQPRQGPPSPADMLARFERMKTENPEQYERIMQMRERMNTEIENRANFLSSVDTRLLTREQRETHAAFLEKFAQANEMRQKLESGEASFQELMPVVRELGQLIETERDILLQAAGRSAGYNRQESEKFAATIKEIIQVTDMPRGPGGFGGRGGRGR